MVTDGRRASEPWFVLTGDTLFSGAVGRPDLPGQALLALDKDEFVRRVCDGILPKPAELCEVLAFDQGTSA